MMVVVVVVVVVMMMIKNELQPEPSSFSCYMRISIVI
jgi:hypothetical protein